MKRSIKTVIRRAGAAGMAGLMLAAAVLPAARASALVTNPTPTAKVSFTFDDGLASSYSLAAPTLAKYGLSGTNYVITGCVGMTTAPNTCHADTSHKYMNWTQIKALQNTYKWEIGSHTATHPYMASFDANDGQPNPLTTAQVIKELTDSRNAITTNTGVIPTSYASPYGDYNTTTLQEIAKLYKTHRGFADQNNNDYPYNELLLNNFQVQNPVTVAQVKAKIDDAITNKRWLILTFHEIATIASTDPDEYQYSNANLDAIAAYVKTKQTAGQLQSVNVSQGPVSSDTNMFTNGTFANGLTGWTTDNANAFKADSGLNGYTPGATSSVKITAGTTAAHLYSSKVTVDPNTTYLLKNFLNVKTYKSGEVAFYMDEYDASGNWISGQYKKAERSAFVENMNFTYKPTSTRVASTQLQVIVTANSGITGYLDSAEMFALTSATVPAPTNLVANGTFDAGISAGWTTDDATNITADKASNGSPANVVNSVKLVSGTAKQGHLFSPVVAVSSTKTYTLSSYLNLKAITSGEIGFYIDEYDTNGNWISGQYKTGVRAASAADVSMAYVPSSATVAKASLQVIVTQNSGITGYVDNIRWYQN